MDAKSKVGKMAIIINDDWGLAGKLGRILDWGGASNKVLLEVDGVKMTLSKNDIELISDWITCDRI